MSRKRQSIGINFDAKCTAQCGHCCVSSSPTATARLPDDQVMRIVDDAIGHPDVYEIGLTGGEPLMRVDFALKIISRAAAGGLSVTCVSNGYWGFTPERATSMFERLEAAGLKELVISFDDFHAPFIPTSRISNVLVASHRSAIKVILNMAVSQTNDSFGLLRELGDSALGVPVTRFSILAAGAGKQLGDGEYIRRPLDDSHYKCPGFEVIYHHDGRVMPCCSPSVFDTHLAVARTTDTVEESIQSIETNGILAIMQREGLDWFLDRIKQSRPESPAAMVEEVVSPCELCGLIFEDKDNIDALRDQIHEYFEELETSRVRL